MSDGDSSVLPFWTTTFLLLDPPPEGYIKCNGNAAASFTAIGQKLNDAIAESPKKSDAYATILKPLQVNE